jgi:membrane protease YdiL (CAAX protease family)
MNVPIRHLFGGATGLSFAIVAICTTVVAPMMEELLFRGVLFRSLATARPGRTGSIVAAVLSALLFALAHGEVAQFPGLFLLGVVLAWTVAKTRRLAPAIVTHMSFNAVALMTLMIQRAGHA